MRGRGLLVIAGLGLWLVEGAHADNPWGFNCGTLQDCLHYVTSPSLCTADDANCLQSEETSPLQPGLDKEFEKFGRAAVPPLLEMLRDKSPLVRERAAEILGTSDHVLPEDYDAIFAAWRTGGIWNALLASQVATPEFANEVINEVRRNPDPYDLPGSTFSNFRARAHDTILAHIECAREETCDPGYARLQFQWLSSNTDEVASVAPRLLEAIDNPQAPMDVRLTALSFFHPNEYFRTREQLAPYALSLLRALLASGAPELQFEAAKTLVAYGDAGGTDVLLRYAETASLADRKAALIALADLATSISQHAPRIRKLLADPEWDIRRYAVILLMVMRDNGSIDELIRSIDPKDWLLTYAAVNALRIQSDPRSSEVLRRAAAAYWHPLVREAAREGPLFAVEGQKGSFAFAAQDMDIRARCKRRFESDGYQFVPDFITGPDILAEVEKAVRHNRENFSRSLLDQPAMRDAKQAGTNLRYREWEFVGTDPEEGEGKLAVNRIGGPPKELLAANIKAVFLWHGEPYAFTGTRGPGFESDGRLYRLVLSSENNWTAQAIFRVTGLPEVWIAPDETIGILGAGGSMTISPSGEPRWLYCPEPAFP